jgi:hypothetical protein
MYVKTYTTLDQQIHSYYTVLYLQYNHCESVRHVSVPCWDHHQGHTKTYNKSASVGQVLCVQMTMRGMNSIKSKHTSPVVSKDACC